MLHGDLVTLTDRGILVHEKALEPVGIYDQSICWGVWAASPHPDYPPKDKLNLIISPFHPKTWPFLIRLEINMFNVKGALSRMAKVIADNNLSILCAQGAPTGFRHVTLVVIAESTAPTLADLKKEKEDFDDKNPTWRSPGMPSARSLATKIATEMLVQARTIERALLMLKTESLERYRSGSYSALETVTAPLYDLILDLEQKRFLFDENKVANRLTRRGEFTSATKAKEYIRFHLPKAATAHYMQRLAYFSIYGGGREVPFALHYKSDSALLELERPGLFTEGSLELKSAPAPAVATFNSLDKYLRLIPITEPLGKLTRIGVEYQVEETHPRATEPFKGLYHLICEELWKSGADLVHNSNKWTRYGYSEEAGLLSFIAHLPPAMRFEEIETQLRQVGQRQDLREHVRIKNVSASSFPSNSLFVSLHLGHPRELNIRRILERIAADAGFKATIVETYVSPATGKILAELNRCQAFLQLLSFRADENPDAVSFSWLDFEYGVAAGRGLPTIRLVDVVRKPYHWWQGKIATNIDQRPKDFRSDVSDDQLADQLREAVQELAREVVRRQ